MTVLSPVETTTPLQVPEIRDKQIHYRGSFLEKKNILYYVKTKRAIKIVWLSLQITWGKRKQVDVRKNHYYHIKITPEHNSMGQNVGQNVLRGNFLLNAIHFCVLPSTALVEKKAKFLVSRGFSFVKSGVRV